MEGWPGAKTSNSEGGLQYSKANNWYTLYAKTAGSSAYHFAMGSFPAGHSIEINLIALSAVVPGGMCTTLPCLEITGSLLENNCKPSGHYICNTFLTEAASGWAGNCCIFGRVVSIAQNYNAFSDLSVFGPVSTSYANMCQQLSTCMTWSGGGVQNWPNDSTRIIVTNYSSSGQTDKINLHE